MRFSFHVLLTCFSIFIFKSILAKTLNSNQEDLCTPNQIHISLGDAYYNTILPDTARVANSNASAFVTWQTKDLCNNTYLSLTSGTKRPVNVLPSEIWHDKINATIDASRNAGEEGVYISYSHTAILKDLKPGVNYTYHILSTDDSRSIGPFSFNLPHLTHSTEKTKVLIYADIDTSFNNVTINTLNHIAKTNPTAFDFQLFLGDLGYNIFTESGKRGEYFFNTAQPFLSTWPFMVTAGNHENFQNYSFLNFRTRMPLYNKTNNHYYSFNVGKMHLVGVNYYFFDENPDLRDEMYQWIEDDLKAADADRENRPWIIVFSHQPLYCSYSSMLDPNNKRCYFFAGKNENWEDLYDRYKVDIVLQGHVHYWERTGPVYRNQSANYTSWTKEDRSHHIINPQAPIYTIEGSAGNNYFMISDPSPLADYSINYDLNLGYSTLTVVNDSALYYEHIKSSNGEVIDYFYLLKGNMYPTGEDVEEYEPLENKTSLNMSHWIIGGCVLGLVLMVSGGWMCHRAKKKREANDLYQSMMKDKETEISKLETVIM